MSRDGQCKCHLVEDECRTGGVEPPVCRREGGRGRDDGRCLRPPMRGDGVEPMAGPVPKNRAEGAVDVRTRFKCLGSRESRTGDRRSRSEPAAKSATYRPPLGDSHQRSTCVPPRPRVQAAIRRRSQRAPEQRCTHPVGRGARARNDGQRCFGSLRHRPDGCDMLPPCLPLRRETVRPWCARGWSNTMRT